MTTSGVEDRLQAIQEQLDSIQHDLQIRNLHLAEMQELKADLTVIVKDVMRTAIVELDDVAPFLQTGDFLSLAKKILRSTNRISASLSKLESAGDFFADVRPVSNDLFNRFIRKLDELETKGYFRVGADLQGALDALVRLLASKDVLAAVSRTLQTANRLQADEVDRYSLWRVYRVTRTPDMQRLMGIVMSFLQALATELDSAGPDATTSRLNDDEEGADAASRDRP